MKAFDVRWVPPGPGVGVVAVEAKAMTPALAAENVYGVMHCKGPREFTVIAEDGHTSLVKVGE